VTDCTPGENGDIGGAAADIDQRDAELLFI